MAQTIQGYFQEGRFISPHKETIPDYIEVYVVITNRQVHTEQTKAQMQRQAFEQFTQAIKTAAPLGDDFDEIIKQGINVCGEVDV